MNYYMRILRQLDAKLKKRVILLQLVFLFGSFLQLTTVFSMAPFISVLSNPEIIQKSTYLNEFYLYVGAKNAEEFLLIFGFFVIGTIVINNAYQILQTWLVQSTTMKIGAHFQAKVYDNFLAQDYVFFAQQSSSHLIAVITQHVSRLIYMVIQPMISFVAQLFMVGLILAALVYKNPLIAFSSMVVVAGVYFLIYKLIRNKTVAYGKEIHKLANERQMVLSESICGIKDVKLKGLEGWYGSILNKNIKKSLYFNSYIGLAADIPRYVIETMVFSAIIGLSIMLIMKNGIHSDAIGVLSLYAIAGYKLLPAAQGAYKDFSNIKAHGTVLDLCENYFNLPIHDEGNKSNSSVRSSLGAYPIRFENIFFRYPGAQKDVITNISFTVRKNAITTFVGGSGAGKSTVVDLILGLLIPASGKILIGEVELTRDILSQWRIKIGYVPQDIYVLDASIKVNVAFGCEESSIDEQKVMLALQKANLDVYINSLWEGIEFQVGENGARLSGGQKQRLALARALYHSPEFIVLDEATSALDNISENEVLRTLITLSQTTTIIMIAHRNTTIAASDYIVFLDKGVVVAEGAYEALLDINPEFKKFIHQPAVN